MAHFYGGVIGKAKTMATRLGSEKSGITTFCNGWNLGVDVDSRLLSDGQDAFVIKLTTGSSNARAEVILGTVVLENDEPVLVISDKGKERLR
jgi:hypothetical protein